MRRSILFGLAAAILLLLSVLSGCYQKSQPADSSFAPQKASPATATTVKGMPRVWQGTSFYDGLDANDQRLESMTDLLDRHEGQQLTAIARISWSGCAFHRIRGLERLPNLIEVMLGGNQIESMTGLEQAPRLSVVNLSQNRIERIEGLRALGNLRELYLAHNRISRIEGLEGLSKLEVLILVGNDIEVISGVSHLKALKRFEVAGNRLRNIVALRDLPNLELVSIESSRNQLDEESLRFIEEWNASHADKPGLQLRSGAAVPGEQAAVTTEPGPEAHEAP